MQEIVVEGKLRQFIREYCDGRGSLQLLLFLGRHPLARFSQLAIVHALDAQKTDTDEAIQHLTDKGLVVTRIAENGLCFYSLTEDESLRDRVSELVTLDWWQFQLMLEQIQPTVEA